MTEVSEWTLARVETPTRLAPAWWAIVARFLLHGLVVSTWVSRIPALQSSLNLNNAALGLCLLGTAVGSALAIPVTGWLVSRLGSKRIAAWSTVGFAAALAGPGLAGSAPTLFLALMAFGAMAGANDVSINAQGVALERAMNAPTMSRFHAMFSIGGLSGAALGASIAARDVSPAMHLSAAAACFVVIALFTAPFLYDGRDQSRASRPPLRFRRLPRSLSVLALLGFCLFLCEGAMADWSGVYLHQVLNANPAMAAAAYAVFSLGMSLFRLAGDFITARLGPVRTVRAGALLAAAGLSLALSARSPQLALLGFALTGAGYSVIVPLVFAASGRAVAGGSAIALVSGAGYFGFLFGPPLIGLIAHVSSLRVALLLVLALSLCATVFASAVDADTRDAPVL